MYLVNWFNSFPVYLLLIFLSMLFSCTAENTAADNSDSFEEIIERIDGPANFRDKVNGKLLFEFYDGVEVQATKFKADWCEAATYVTLTKEEYDKETILSGSKILGPDGQEIGQAKTDVLVDLLEENGGEYSGFLYGYTHKNNIKPESLIENKLLHVLESTEHKLEAHMAFLKKYRFEPFDGFEGIEGYFVYENWITDPSPGFRLLLCYKKGLLFSIAHSRPLPFEDFFRSGSQTGYTLSFSKNFPNTEGKDFLKEFDEKMGMVD